MTIKDFIDKASSIDMSEVINTAIRLNEDEILSLNTEGQLFERGIDSWPRKISPLDRDYPTYARRTIIDKKIKGHPTDRVTLRDTGRFQESFKIEYRRGEIEITAPPQVRGGTELTSHLKERYGELIFGLTQVNTTKLQSIIKEDIILLLRNA